jgi:hypothetical protein
MTIPYETTKYRPIEYKTYCDTCHTIVNDSAPGQIKLPWSAGNICPYCKGKIDDPDAPKWGPSR